MKLLQKLFPSTRLRVEVFQGNDTAWDAIIDQSDQNPNIYHSAAWYKYISHPASSLGTLFFRLLVYNPKTNFPLAACLLFIDDVAKIAFWLYGPIFLPQETACCSKVEIVKALIQFAQTQGINRIEPVYLPYALMTEAEISELRHDNIVANEHATYIIDLRGKTEKDLWNTFERSVRKNCNKCERLGVTVKRLVSPMEVEASYIPILRANRERMGFGMPPAYPNAIMWEALRSHSALLEVFMAYQGVEPLAGLGIIGRRGFINEMAVAQSNHCFEEKIPAHDLIKWEIIQWCLRRGVQQYDLTGVNPNPKSEKEKGIHRYKKKFGGNYYRSWVLSKVFSS